MKQLHKEDYFEVEIGIIFIWKGKKSVNDLFDDTVATRGVHYKFKYL